MASLVYEGFSSGALTHSEAVEMLVSDYHYEREEAALTVSGWQEWLESDDDPLGWKDPDATIDLRVSERTR